MYGLAGLKTHCKLCLVVRREGDELRRYVHVGTGNYNPITARLYEDLGLLTADEELGAEVSHLFNYLTGFSRNKRVPLADRRAARHARADDRDDRARGGSCARRSSPGRIVMKLNNLVDPRDHRRALPRRRSAACRSTCWCAASARCGPGVKKLSKNIRVRSILGRFLEHSRIYYFQNGGDEEFYIGSADMMQRNLDRPRRGARDGQVAPTSRSSSSSCSTSRSRTTSRLLGAATATAAGRSRSPDERASARLPEPADAAAGGTEHELASDA